MAQFDARTMIDAAAAAAAGSASAQTAPHQLAAAAETAAAERVVPALSPIVLAGAVRMIELALVALIGIADLCRLRRAAGRRRVALLRRHRRRLGAVDAGVPDRRHLPGAGVPRPREAILPARLGVVGGVPDRHRRRRSSPRPATSSRASGSAASTSSACWRCWRSAARCSSLVRRWTREGRLTRRTVIVGGGAAGEALVSALRDQSDSDVRVIGVFDDRGDDRSPTPMRRPAASSAPSTIWSSSRAAPASIW